MEESRATCTNLRVEARRRTSDGSASGGDGAVQREGFLSLVNLADSADYISAANCRF
jgi:hypothetical protein